MGADNSDSEQPKKQRGRPFAKGTSGNPGGRPKALRQIEAMLDAEHRTVDQMRETFALIRKVAHGVEEPVFYQGAVCGYVMKYDGAWMNLYLRRVLGPEREIEVDLTDAPDEVLRWWAEKVN